MVAKIASKLPWKEFLVVAAHVLAAARDVFNKWTAKPKPPPVDPHAETKTQIAAIAQRLEALEATETDQVKLVRDMAEQLQSLSMGLSQISSRGTGALWLAGGALVLSCIAIAIAFFR